MVYTKLTKFPNFKNTTPAFKINDTVAFSLYPGKFFVEGGDNMKHIDFMPKVYNERSRKFVINPNMMGTVEEIFLKENTKEVWVALYNYYLDLYFLIPAYNVQRIEVTA